MEISAFSSSTYTFKGCMPIYAAYSHDKKGMLYKLTEKKLDNITKEFIRRLNTPGTREHEFFKHFNFFKGFIAEEEQKPIFACSTKAARTKHEPRHILFGQDAYTAKSEMEKTIKNPQSGSEQIAFTQQYIRDALINGKGGHNKRLKAKRFLEDSVGERAGIILGVDKIKGKLEYGIAIKTLSHKLRAKLPIPTKANPNPQAITTLPSIKKVKQPDLPNLSWRQSGIDAIHDNPGYRRKTNSKRKFMFKI